MLCGANKPVEAKHHGKRLFSLPTYEQPCLSTRMLGQRLSVQRCTGGQGKHNIQHWCTVQVEIVEQPALDTLHHLLQQPGARGSFDFVFIGKFITALCAM